MNILVTGGAGFIGSNFLNLFVPRYPEYNFINFDKLTYAANLLNLKSIENLSNYTFEQGDIVDYPRVIEIFDKYNPDLVIHFAAESHVDRSIIGPTEFVQANIIGIFNLFKVYRKKMAINIRSLKYSKSFRYSQDFLKENKLSHRIMFSPMKYTVLYL